MSDIKPDGWVCWHPNLGSPEYTEIWKHKDMAVEVRCRYEGHYVDNDFGGGQIIPEDLFEAGWKVRPVKLIFLDVNNTDREG